MQRGLGSLPLGPRPLQRLGGQGPLLPGGAQPRQFVLATLIGLPGLTIGTFSIVRQEVRVKEERTTPLRERMSELVRESWPFIATMCVVLILCILFPALVTRRTTATDLGSKCCLSGLPIGAEPSRADRALQNRIGTACLI